MSEGGTTGGGAAGSKASDVLKRRGDRKGKLGRSLERGSPRAREAGQTSEGAPEEVGRAVPEDDDQGERGREEAPGRRRAVRPEKPVRITVDLDPELHRFLRGFAFEREAKGTEVVRALLDMLRHDPGLAEELGRRLDGP